MPVADNEAVLVLDIGDVEADGVMLTDAPGESEDVGVALAVDDALTVDEPESEPVDVPVRVEVAVPVTLVVCDAVGDREEDADIVVLAEPVSLPVLLGLAPKVTLAVGVHDTERERLTVDVGVSDDVGVGDAVGDPVGVTLADCVDVVEGVPLLLGVIDALAPRERLGVAVFEMDGDSVTTELGVCDGVPLDVAVGVTVEVPVGVGSALVVDEVVTVGETVAERDTEGVPLAVPPVERVVVGDAVIVDE